MRLLDGLPRRDLLLLPLIALGTLVVVLAVAELGSRVVWPAYSEGSCIQSDDGVRFRLKPSCEAHVKIVESTPATYHFNECGFRSSRSCGARPSGTLRIASLGSSSMLGYWVRSEEVLPEVLATRLTRACGRSAESQNLSVPGATLYDMVARADEVIALRPDVVLLGVSARDLNDTIPDAPAPSPAHPAATPPSLKARLKGLLLAADLNSRVVAVVRHYLYLNRERYIQSVFRRGEDVQMRKPLSSIWEQRLDVAGRTVGALNEKLGGAGIPLIVVYLPDLAELQFIKARSAYPDLDPYEIESRVARVAAAHRVGFVSSLESFAQAPDPTIYYFAGDGHLSGPGQKELADVVSGNASWSRVGSFENCQLLAGAVRVLP